MHFPPPPSRTDDVLSTPRTLDLSACDREPIRIPGSVQPHGALLALRFPDLTVLQASANTAHLLGVPAEELTGAPVSRLVGASQIASVRSAIETCVERGECRADEPLRVTLAVQGRAARFDVTLSRTPEAVLLEFEPATERDALSLFGFHALIRHTLSRVRGASGVRPLAQAIAEQMRVITGYDRVWVYRFHEDWHGEIIAESKRQGIQSWLGLHYPASDIPAQARALFLEHPLRLIADVDYVPSPLVPQLNPDTGAPLDLGAAVLRSVSPVHLQYMRNMGTRASIVVSLVQGARLWGLISGHNYAASRVPSHEVRTVCEFLGQAFAIQLALLEAMEERDHALRVRSITGTLLTALARAGDVTHALIGGATTLLDVADATGAAIVIGDRVASIGAAPPDEGVRALAAWLVGMGDREGTGGIHATDTLATEFAPARAWTPVASGLLACELPQERPGAPPAHLMWFRGEQRQVIPWAGNPDKPVASLADDPRRLDPRGSFELWEQEVSGRAATWHAAEIDAARALQAVVGPLIEHDGTPLGEVTRAELVQALDALAHDAAAAAEDPAATSAQAMSRLAARLDSLVKRLGA